MSTAVRTSVEARKHVLLSEALETALSYSIREAQLLEDSGNLNEYLDSIGDENRGLRLWCQYGHSRRGLESYACRLYQETRKRDRRNLVQQIAILSKKGARPELIRRISERASPS